MMILTARNRLQMALPAVRFERFDLRVILFLGLIGFLLFWSFRGKDIEKRVYVQHFSGYQALDNLGAEIVVPQSSGHEPSVVVGRVKPNSPAERAGMKSGDRIVGIGGQLISSADMARYMVRSKRNDTLKLTINRNDRNRSVYVRFNEPFFENQALKNIGMKYHSLSAVKQFVVILIFLKIVIALFFLLYKNILKRTAIVLLFAMSILFIGVFFRVYSPVDAFFAIKFNTISLLLGMSVITVVLNEAGFFRRVAVRVSNYAGKSSIRLLICFCLITYFFSLLVNNLTTILIIVPMTLNLAEILKIDPRPIIIGEVISSNLGGASTMMGDFPNMLISSEAGIGFGEFLIFMTPICLVLLGILLVYLKMQTKDLFVGAKKEAPSSRIGNRQPTHRERWAVRRSIFVLCHVIFLFIVSGTISFHPSAIALFGGLSLFLFSGIDRRNILSNVGFNDILFFTGLFVVVGGLEASGLLQYISKGLAVLSFGKPWALCVILMWSAALFTSFLNAGPTTALFFPIVLGLTLTLPHHVMWWALSLGVLAGSSATIFGATAGPVAATLVENFNSKHRLAISGGNTISFGQFARTGVPVMLLFLSVSSVYIVYLCFHA